MMSVRNDSSNSTDRNELHKLPHYIDKPNGEWYKTGET